MTGSRRATPGWGTWIGVAVVLLIAFGPVEAKPRKTRPARGPSIKRASLTSSGPLSAVSAVVVDVQTGSILYGKNPEQILPIASITKLMTALVFLETQPDLSRTTTVEPECMSLPGRKRFRVGERVVLYDMLCAALIASDNMAAKSLALTTGPEWTFVARMNAKARDLGLLETHFADPTGLNPDNVSTAVDLTRLVSAASRDGRISQIMRTQDYIFRSDTRFHRLHTTNRLLKSELNIVGGKTGFIRQSGYCLTTFVRGENQREVAAAVLGSRSNTKRFTDMKRILEIVLAKK